MIKTITVEFTIKTQVVVDIEDEYYGETRPSADIKLVTWNSGDIQNQIQQHLDDNIDEILEE